MKSQVILKVFISVTASTAKRTQVQHMPQTCSQPRRRSHGQLLMTPAGSLNTKVNIKPTAHLFCASQASWESDMAEAKKFQTYPQM